MKSIDIQLLATKKMFVIFMYKHNMLLKTFHVVLFAIKKKKEVLTLNQRAVVKRVLDGFG